MMHATRRRRIGRALLAAAALASGAARAATPPEEPRPGDSIASVTLELPPNERAQLERYVDVTPGAPYDPETIRRSVELLFAAGQFEDVVVSARREAGGWALAFSPRPAPRLVHVRVESPAAVSPGAVRKAARLARGEALWPVRLARAERDVASALQADGWLDTRVEARAERTPLGADAVLRVQAGPRARVARIDLAGVGASLEALLRPWARPRVGDVYRREQARKAAERLRRTLVGLGHWRATAEPRETHDPADGRTTLRFDVAPGPVTRVEFTGTHLSAGLRGTLVERLREGGLSTDVVEETSDRIESALRSQGYREAAVTHHEEPRAGGVALVYDVQAGALAQVYRVRITGADDVEPPLTLVLATRGDVPLRDDLIDEDTRTLRRALQERGYAGATVEPEVPEGGGLLPVTFRVRPGPRTLVADVSVETPLELPGRAPELQLSAGQPYRLRDVAADVAALGAAWRNAGFLQAEVTPAADFSDDKSAVRLRLRVTPGSRTFVGRVLVAGLEHSREPVVRRELALEEGQPLGLAQLVESRRRLGALGIFQRVNVRELNPAGRTGPDANAAGHVRRGKSEGVGAVDDAEVNPAGRTGPDANAAGRVRRGKSEGVGADGQPDASEQRDLLVEVDEARRTTVAYGVGYAERELARGSVEVTRRNLFGLDRTLSVFGRGSFRGSRALVSFREPYLLGRRRELFVTGFREGEDRVSFDYTRLGGLVQTALALGTHTSAILRLQYQRTELFNVDVPLSEVDRQFQSSTTAGPSVSLLYDTRDDPLDPHRGRFLGADVQLSQSFLGGDRFIKGFLQASGYERLAPSVLLALSARLGLARTFGTGAPPGLPLADRFFAGGDYSLRGFKTDTAGPLEPSEDGTRRVPTGGNALLLGGAELRFDASRFISVALFGDVGNVFAVTSDFDLSHLRYTAGLGLRYKSALGPLRVDWGYKLDRRPGESAWRLHVTVGHAF